jgi:VanZ family protein
VRLPPFRAAVRAAALLAVLAASHPLGCGSASAADLLLPASAQGGWTAADKELHFAGCLAIAASLRVAGRSDVESFGGAVGVGVIKEVYDATLKPSRSRRGASWKDLIADALGAAAGIAIVGALKR